MKSESWIDGVQRDHRSEPINIMLGGPIYLVDKLVAVRFEYGFGMSSRKNPVFYAPDGLPIQLGRELASGRVRNSEDPDRIGSRSLDLSETPGKDVVYVGNRLYAISFEGGFRGE